MLYLGKDHPFCEVCKEQLRKSISQASNVTNLFFQPYADRFYESDSGKDMSEYFIIRKGTNETTGDKLGGALKLEYTDSDGNKVDGTPSKAGTYTVKATFSGNDTYGSATQTGTYTIELPDLIDLKVSDKVSDGKPIDVDFTVDYDKEYTSKVHYTGTMPYTTEQKDKYDSDEAPVRPGDYTVTVKIYDKETGKEVSEDSQTFKIKFNKTKVVNNDDQNYWGATTGYNLKHVTITGEGFTADEEDEFQKLAKEYIDYILDTEPFKETKQYFNFTTVESLSNESGIGNSPAKDTYMQLTRDDFGRIQPTRQSDAAANYIGRYVGDDYNRFTIVIVNDDKVTEGDISGKIIYVGKDNKDYAAKTLLNRMTSKSAGYTPDEEGKAAQRMDLLNYIYMYWYGYDYITITSRAYDEDFYANGTAYDLTPYFHTYIGKTEVPQDKINLKLTYYTDNNGKPGDKLDSAPSEAGTYHVMAENVLSDGADCTQITLDGEDRYLVPAHGWTTYTIKPTKKVTPKVTLSTKTYTYNGKVRKPSVSVTADGEKLSKDSCTVSYASGRKNVGTYKVTVKLKGEYEGTGSASFKIVPKSTSIKKLSRGSKSFKVSWSRQSRQVTGYQIRYSTSKSFSKKSTKTATVKSYKTTKKTVKKLKAGRKYYVKVRTYKKVKGTNYYSSWSKVKTVRTK